MSRRGLLAGLLALGACGKADASAPEVAFLGDSLTAGIKGDPQQQFPAYVAGQLGIRAINLGVGGAQAAPHRAAPNLDPFSFCHVAKALRTGDFRRQRDHSRAAGRRTVAAMRGLDLPSLKGLVFFYGTNDASNKVPLDEFRASLRSALFDLRAAAPDLPLYGICPYERVGNGEGLDLRGTVAPYASSVEEVATEFGVPCLNLYRERWITEQDAAERLDKLLLHPRDRTEYARLGKRVADWLGPQLAA